MTDDGPTLERRFEGRPALDELLRKAGSVADTEDVARAFAAAVNAGVPPGVVIDALWDDEPRFERPADAQRLFSNLLGLHDAIAAGTAIDLAGPLAPAGRHRAPPPAPFGAEGPDEAFVEAAMAYLFDHPRERERLGHVFDSRHDELVSWMDARGLSDDGFALARSLCADVFALLELGGRPGRRVTAAELSAAPALPGPLLHLIDEGLFEAENDEDAPMPAGEIARVKEAVLAVTGALWGP